MGPKDGGLPRLISNLQPQRRPVGKGEAEARGERLLSLGYAVRQQRQEGCDPKGAAASLAPLRSHCHQLPSHPPSEYTHLNSGSHHTTWSVEGTEPGGEPETPEMVLHGGVC